MAIIDGYAREAGVRNLEKALDKTHRKIAKSIVIENKQEEKFIIDKHSVEKYLGKPVFRDDELKRATRPGMAVGLAWTSMGGDTLIIEAMANPGKEGFKLTGQMGSVMQESAGIAYTYVRNIVARKYGIEAQFFESRQIHLHIPEGATPKDGPSAGITMATTLLSLVLDKRIKDRLAMTGELSLTGQVLPIGGLREKTVAAKRNKIKEIIIPRRTKKTRRDSGACEKGSHIPSRIADGGSDRYCIWYMIHSVPRGSANMHGLDVNIERVPGAPNGR